MESEAERTVTAGSATQQLAQYERIQEHDAAPRPSRGYWHLMLWSAMVVTVYVAAFLLLFGVKTEEEITSQPGGYQVHWLLVVPLMAFSFLVSGARERFAVRSTSLWPSWVVLALFIGAFVAMGIFWFADIGYPWWLNIALPLLMFLVMAAGPVRGLRSAPRSETESWPNEPLSGAARVITVVLGLILGVLLVVSTNHYASIFLLLGAMVFIVLGTGMQASRFGLSRAGNEWGPLHWGSFGVCAALIFATVVLRGHANLPVEVLSPVIGVLVALIMVVAALLPRRRRTFVEA